MDVPNLRSSPWVTISEQRKREHTPVQHKQHLVGIGVLSFCPFCYLSFLLFITCRGVGFVLFFSKQEKLKKRKYMLKINILHSVGTCHQN